MLIKLLLSLLVSSQHVNSECPDLLPSGETCPPGHPRYFPDPEECSKYWLCYLGCAFNEKCQDEFLFDTLNGYCNHPDEVDCGDRPCLDPDHCSTTTTSPPTPTALPKPCISTFPPNRHCPASATKDFPDIDDCSKYWHCEGGCVTSVQCEANFLFDMGLSQCKEAAETDCSIGHRPCMDPQHCPCVTYDADDDYFCQEEDFEEYFPDWNDCARYRNCSGGCFSRHLCPNNFLYNVEYQWCSYPHEIDCGKRPCLYPDRCGQPQTSSSTSSTDPASSTATTPATTTEDCGHTEFCQDHLSMGLYADPFNCRKYWRCTSNGVGGEHYTCEDGKLFDLKYMSCNFPYLVDCQERPICDDCDENCEYKTTTPHVEHCEVHQCTQDGFFCETTCSNEYCRCFGGVGFLQHCPEGLLWDCNEEVCNYPCFVDEGACCPA